MSGMVMRAGAGEGWRWLLQLVWPLRERRGLGSSTSSTVYASGTQFEVVTAETVDCSRCSKWARPQVPDKEKLPARLPSSALCLP